MILMVFSPKYLAISLFVFVALTRISLQTRYPSLADYERIDAAMIRKTGYTVAPDVVYPVFVIKLYQPRAAL